MISVNNVCRCNEISNCEEMVKKVNDALNLYMGPALEEINTVKSKLQTVSWEYSAAVSVDNQGITQDKIKKLADDLETERNAINNCLIEQLRGMERTISVWKAEDAAYHEAQRLAQEAAQSEMSTSSNSNTSTGSTTTANTNTNTGRKKGKTGGNSSWAY